MRLRLFQGTRHLLFGVVRRVRAKPGKEATNDAVRTLLLEPVPTGFLEFLVLKKFPDGLEQLAFAEPLHFFCGRLPKGSAIRVNEFVGELITESALVAK